MYLYTSQIFKRFVKRVSNISFKKLKQAIRKLTI